MFSEAINSISWRCRPSSPLMAAAISGSAWSRVAVKNESGAEAVLVLAEELMGGISPPPQAFGARCGRSCVAVGSGDLRDTISGGAGQALAVRACYLCKIWWGERWVASLGRPRPRPRHGRACPADARAIGERKRRRPSDGYARA